MANHTFRGAVENALKNALRYEKPGYCQRCAQQHDGERHLTSINLIAEEIYLWLGFGRDKQDLRLFTRIIKALEDAPVTGQKDADIQTLTNGVVAAFGRA